MYRELCIVLQSFKFPSYLEVKVKAQALITSSKSVGHKCFWYLELKDWTLKWDFLTFPLQYWVNGVFYICYLVIFHF